MAASVKNFNIKEVKSDLRKKYHAEGNGIQNRLYIRLQRTGYKGVF